ncbi:MAG: M18 family aminopeptidase [Desulfobulbaceae bacterium]|nr:MAG: M18 family aminopeptidase [Desulfobulbaceae bacterium]
MDKQIKTYNSDLFNFIQASPTPYHCINNCSTYLESKGYEQLFETDYWALKRPGTYLVSRNGTLIAFHLNHTSEPSAGFRIIGAHTDSPALQIKPHSKNGSDDYFLTGVEKYGGPLLSTWFDRDLSIAGRVVVKLSTGKLETFLINVEKPLLFIPSVAIHLNRKANEANPIKVQEHMSPLWGAQESDSPIQLPTLILDFLKNQYQSMVVEKLLGFDLFCYDTSEPVYIGLNDDFISAPRLDNQLSCFSAIRSIATAKHQTNSMIVLSNHEEIGSRTSSGALSNFLDEVFNRIYSNPEKKSIGMRNSFFLSLDNAHATHPNYGGLTDSDHPVTLNNGPVIKINANQRYATNALTGSLIRDLAESCGLETQDFIMNSDMPAGSTIGPLLSAKLGLTTADVGAPTFGMHSIRELTGSKDPYELMVLSKALFERKTVTVEE